jgi:hypothetical protein
MISGYVTETHDDHQEQLNWLKNNAHFANSPVVNIEFGQGLSILPGTFLHRNAKELGVELVNDGVYVAWSNPSIQSTPEVRLQRLDEIKNYAQAQGFSVSKINNNHKIIHDYLTDKSK